MTKRKAADFLLFLLYCVPWCFCLMYWEGQCDTLLCYPPLVLGYAALGWYCGKTGRIPLAVTGSVASCALSFLLACRYIMEQSYRFKPFGLTGFVIFLSVYTLAVQMLIWKWQRKGKEAPLVVQFFEIAAMLLVPAVILVFLMLLLPRILH